MAQFDRARRSSDNNRSPKTPTSPTFEQLLHGEDLLRGSSSSPTSGMNHDQQDYTGNYNNKKSVLEKVKERAKKLRHTLSGRKKHGNELHDDNTPPSWGVSLEDEDEDDDDPEYLGAPMYESELAPENYREYARQHPRANPVVSEEHIMPGSVKNKTDEGNEKSISPNMTMGRSLSLKLAPTRAAVSDATKNTIASKFAGLTVATPETQETAGETARNDMMNTVIGKESTGSPQRWDKGVSVKEYFLNKLGPGDDERALSQAITSAVSPRKTTGDAGVVEMVKEAVTSFFRHEENSSSSMTSKNTTNSSPKLLASPKAISDKKNSISSTNSPTSKLSFYANANSSPLVPISTNAHPVREEENHGRILQPN